MLGSSRLFGSSRGFGKTNAVMLALSCMLSVSGALSGIAAFADPLDPNLLPPEIIVPVPGAPTAPAAVAPQTPAPGMQQGEIPSTSSNNNAGKANPTYMELNPQLTEPDPSCPGCTKHQSIQNASGGNSGGGSGFTNPGLLNGQPVGGAAAAPATQAAQGAPAGGAVQADPVAVLQTTKGPIQIRLFRSFAPNTVSNFVDLVNRGFYNGLTWHRIEPGFCIQTGCPKGDGSGGFIDPATNQERRIAMESSPRLRHNAPGVVAMARFGNDMNSASSQFYITQSAQPHLDNKYAIFGGVVSGMDTVMRMQKGDKILGVTLQQP